jgi:hypothetical protein
MDSMDDDSWVDVFEFLSSDIEDFAGSITLKAKTHTCEDAVCDPQRKVTSKHRWENFTRRVLFGSRRMKKFCWKFLVQKCMNIKE